MRASYTVLLIFGLLGIYSLCYASCRKQNFLTKEEFSTALSEKQKEIDLLRSELKTRVELTDNFLQEEDSKLQNLLEKRTEERFSEIREAINNASKKNKNAE